MKNWVFAFLWTVFGYGLGGASAVLLVSAFGGSEVGGPAVCKSSPEDWFEEQLAALAQLKSLHATLQAGDAQAAARELDGDIAARTARLEAYRRDNPCELDAARLDAAMSAAFPPPGAAEPAAVTPPAP